MENPEHDEADRQTCAMGQGMFTLNHSFLGIYICSRPGLLVRIEVQFDIFSLTVLLSEGGREFPFTKERLSGFNPSGQGLIFQEAHSRDTCGKACDSHESPPRRAEHLFHGCRGEAYLFLQVLKDRGELLWKVELLQIHKAVREIPSRTEPSDRISSLLGDSPQLVAVETALPSDTYWVSLV